MKYFIWSVIIIGAILGLVFWLKTTPEETSVAANPAKEENTQDVKAVEEKTEQKVNRIINKNGMKIEVIKEGSGPEITNGQTAVVDYVGKLTDGKVFDASRNHGTSGFSFSLGAGQVIKGWDQGVLGMKVGETRTLTIPSDLAYGPNGISGVIPPSATLIFEVTLLAIK